MRGYSYHFTDAQGDTHSRYSVRHSEPIYRFAVVYVFPDREQFGHKVPSSKGVSYTSRRDLADKACSQYPGATSVTVYEVNATPGKLKR